MNNVSIRWLVVSGLVVLLAGVATYLVVNAGHTAFMAECTKDHKKYECEVLWNQGHPVVFITTPGRP